jgi:hypothetical protein
MPKKLQKQKKRAKQTMNRSVHSAPAAVSDFLTQSVKFKPSKGGKGLIMEVCLPLCNITGNSAQTAPASINGTLTDASGNIFDLLTVNPVFPIGGKSLASGLVNNNAGTVITSYINPAWSLISAAFTRWRIRKLVFKYMPQSTSTQADQLVFAFAADPNHPVIGLSEIGVMTNATLLNVGDSIPFMPWKEWSLDVSDTLKKEAELFVKETFVPNLGATDDAQVGAITRFSQAGVFACTHSTAQTSPIVYGVLYGCAEFELLEFCPITTIDGGTLSSSAYLELQRQNRILEENLFEIEKQLKRLEKDEETTSSSDCLNDTAVLPQDGCTRSTYRSEQEPRKLSVTRFDFKRNV